MLWGGRFSEPTDDDLRALNDSIGYDKRMYAEDIRGSIAWARAIAGAGVITDDEAAQIVAGLDQVKAEFDAGTFEIKAGDEDIHTAVERRLTEIVGAVGGKLHTGRSRNDQVATDFRMVTANMAYRLCALIAQLQTALIETAEHHINSLMPGYTHVQPAQPVTAAHWLMSYFWMFQRDAVRMEHQGANSADDFLPLGSGALAGTPFAIDRNALALELGFNALSENSLDSVSDRDFAAEFLFAASMLGIHLSRLAEDIVWFSNPAFGFVTLDDRYSTGSSLMPQKRNPDPMELARGKAGRLIGNLTGLLTTLKGLPTSYNKDLQEDKEPVFDSYDTLMKILPVVTAVIRTLKLNPDKMRAALDPDMLATDLADYLVKKGMPFREAHGVSGRAVRLAAEKGVRLPDLTLDDLRGLSPLFDADVTAVFDFEASVARRNSIGGTAPETVRDQIALARRTVQLRLDNSHNAD
ncbi:MAG: argininosuccinate lyase [Chloroflexota bacterium]|nr:argininosuccinate lyase [Chloroflexota bacterium]